MKKIAFPLLISLLAVASCKPSEAEIESMITKTLESKPEIITNAITAQRDKLMAEKEAKKKTLLVEKQDLIEKDGYSLVLGNPDGDVTITAFKDYRCGYCKRSWETVKKVLAADKNVRIVMKEMPILGEQSMKASRLGLASANQGKYAEFYQKMIEHRGGFDEKTILGLAKKAGLDTNKLLEDAKSDEITQKLKQNITLASGLGITGTPAFIIGGNVFPGAITEDVFNKSIKAVREAAQAPDEDTAEVPAKDAAPKDKS